MVFLFNGGHFIYGCGSPTTNGKMRHWVAAGGGSRDVDVCSPAHNTSARRVILTVLAICDGGSKHGGTERVCSTARMVRRVATSSDVLRSVSTTVTARGHDGGTTRCGLA